MWVSLRVYKNKGREEKILVLQWNLFVYTLFSCMYINSNHHNPFVQQGICVFLVRNHKEECVCSSCTTEKKKTPASAVRRDFRNIVWLFQTLGA